MNKTSNLNHAFTTFAPVIFHRGVPTRTPEIITIFHNLDDIIEFDMEEYEDNL